MRRYLCLEVTLQKRRYFTIRSYFDSGIRPILLAFITHNSTIPLAIVARRLVDDLARRQPGESWKQTGREQKEGRKTRNRPNPIVLTSQIKQARAIQALLCTYSVHESHLDHIHLSACWTSLGQLARESAERYGLQKNTKALEPLV